MIIFDITKLARSDNFRIAFENSDYLMGRLEVPHVGTITLDLIKHKDPDKAIWGRDNCTGRLRIYSTIDIEEDIKCLIEALTPFTDSTAIEIRDWLEKQQALHDIMSSKYRWRMDDKKAELGVRWDALLPVDMGGNFVRRPDSKLLRHYSEYNRNRIKELVREIKELRFQWYKEAVTAPITSIYVE